MPDPDMAAFAEMVGAIEPSPGHDMYASFRRTFKRHNYFVLKGRFLIVKISRTERPFWGLGKKFIDLVNDLDNYYVVLLVSHQEGWVFSKTDVNANIRSGKWALRKADKNYKINMPLPDRNAFAGKRGFYKMLGVSES